ncbi:ABC-type lipoprotein export system, ATPase component [Anaerocolumna jejuensis DSM 15929]|uniref:ABC-type lipoprotein export system, ATPase component n=1 Tax=Anaerocolumna jejuensis DSM 15929 TaxID=1121322 RepID=A0A1M7BVI2_9FIRM|nr:ABC transporter ATP-binding protein/permease [Anaerocolumna jejuensis]SHL58579.1 ABC-type lipoprotein export system, ATPase component [Anaerocolumna jejuensis DSM 15929]
MLQLKNIKKSYTTGEFTQVALDGININFRESEFVAILGQSGSGKTTCLNVIGGLDQYDSGDLIINGKSTKDFEDSDWDAYRNNSVVFIFQSYNLISHLSLVDNVEMGMTLSGVSSAEKHSKAINALERVGLEQHIHKKPSQLSGGQMQRVAIARALANDPDIILADEPTGALDSQTSEQIMELIKEIAAEKLVIMVTHNPELAEVYADRVIHFKDGRVVEDSMPLANQRVNENYEIKKTSMSFATALKLSGKNIATKKWRTALTAVASSIGIVGIALILSLSNGFDKKISSYESGSLLNFPLTVTQGISTSMSNMTGTDFFKEAEGAYPEESKVFSHDAAKEVVVHNNIFTDEFMNYIKKLDSKVLDGISYSRNVNMNILKSDGKTASAVNTGSVNITSFPTKIDGDSESYLSNYYELLAGDYPKSENELLLVVDKFNQLDVSAMEALGLDYKAKEINFEDIIGKEYKLILNDNYYKQKGETFSINSDSANLIDLYNEKDTINLKISGIIRANEDVGSAALPAGLAYSDTLAEFFIDNAKDSNIVKAQEKADYNVLTGEVFSEVSDNPYAVTREKVLMSLGASVLPNTISLYPSDFTGKDIITKYLDGWNKNLNDDEKIIYTDMSSLITGLSGGIMDGITLVLIAFAAISLVVSLIMIGIITYISVMERTKEIGVLRALGARKKDVTRVFNAETVIIGTCSGLLGILLAFILTIPINIVLEHLTGLTGVAELNPLHAVLLLTISLSLTVLGGFIPAKMASKMNPVEALRAD